MFRMRYYEISEEYLMFLEETTQPTPKPRKTNSNRPTNIPTTYSKPERKFYKKIIRT